MNSTRQSTTQARVRADVTIAHAQAFTSEFPTEAVLGCTVAALVEARRLTEALAGDRLRRNEAEVARVWDSYALAGFRSEAGRLIADRPASAALPPLPTKSHDAAYEAVPVSYERRSV